MYIRFVSGTNRAPANSQHGVVAELRRLHDEGALPDYEADHVTELFQWLNDHLPCPPFVASKWPASAVSWFKDSAKPMIAVFREIISILEQHGTPTRMLKTRDPGRILYEDNFQIVATSPMF